jgi:hypothetical protein
VWKFAAHVIAFFSYFTVETNILVALALTIFLLQPQAERFLTGPSVTSALVVYVIVVGVVYERLLRHLWHPHGMRLFADMLLHDAVPFLYSLYWLLFQRQSAMVRSSQLAHLPNSFLLLYNVSRRGLRNLSLSLHQRRRAGVGQGFGDATVLLAVFFGLGITLIAIDHALGSGERGRSGLGSAAEL